MPGAGTIPRFAWPIEIDSTCDAWPIEETGGGGAGAVTVDVPDTTSAAPHFWRGDGTAASFETVLKTAMEAVGNFTYTITMASTGIVTIASTGAFTVVWTDPGRQFDGALLGFSVAADSVAVEAPAGVWSVTGTFQAGHVWLPEQVYIRETEKQPRYAGGDTLSLSWRGRGYSIPAAGYVRTLLVDALPGRKVYTAEEVRAQEAFERFYEWLRKTGRFEFTRDWLVTKTPDGVYWIRDRTWKLAWPVTMLPMIRLYNIEFPLAEYVA